MNNMKWPEKLKALVAKTLHWLWDKIPDNSFSSPGMRDYFDIRHLLFQHFLHF